MTIFETIKALAEQLPSAVMNDDETWEVSCVLRQKMLLASCVLRHASEYIKCAGFERDCPEDGMHDKEKTEAMNSIRSLLTSF